MTTVLSFQFGEPSSHTEQRTTQTRQGDTLAWTIPHCEVPLLLNGEVIGYAEIHTHAAWAPDGVPDMSWGFTGRVNTQELVAAITAADSAQEDAQ